MRRRMMLALAVAAVGLLTWAADAASADLASFRCPTSRLHPLVGHRSFNFGNSRIAVALPKRATFVAVPETQPGWAFVQKDGSIRTKLGWWTRHNIKPQVTGQRIDRAVRPLRVEMGVLSYTQSGVHFYPSLLRFPSVGCWRITAKAGNTKLVAIVKVVKQ